jgi:hypothetical protein
VSCSLACELSMLQLFPDAEVPVSLAKYPNVAAWMKRVATVDGWDKVA